MAKAAVRSCRALPERRNLKRTFFGVISPIVVDWTTKNQCDVGFAGDHLLDGSEGVTSFATACIHAFLRFSRMNAEPRP
jgi:hypothetical protein